MTLETPRNLLIENVELNWAKLDTPVNPFGTEQFELQIATTDAAVADQWKKDFLNVKEDKKNPGKFIAALRRKAKRADGSDNGKVRVVDGNKAPFENVRSIGNGSIGNVIIWQAPFDTMGRKGVSSSLTAVQITTLEEFTPSGGVDFDVVPGEDSGQPDNESAMF